MAIELTPFDPADYLVNDAEITVFLEDALASGDPGVFASALSAAARAKGLAGSGETATMSSIEEDEAPPSALAFETVMDLLRQIGLSLHLGPVSARAA